MRINASPGLSSGFLLSRLPALVTRYPKLDIDLAPRRDPSASSHEADIVIRFDKPKDDDGCAPMPVVGSPLFSSQLPTANRQLSTDADGMCGSSLVAASSFGGSAAMAAHVLERLKRRLLVSAAGRNLAIDLADKHGATAPEKLEALIALGSPDGCEMDVLMKARQELGKFRLG